MVNLFNPLYSADTQADKECIGYPAVIHFTLDTSIFFLANQYDVYFKPALYSDASAILPDNSVTNPGTNCFTYLIDGTTVVNTYYEMNWNGHESAFPGRAFFKILPFGPPHNIDIILYTVNKFDFLGYPFLTPTDNLAKLLKNAVDNTITLDNSTNSVYRQYKNARSAVWVFDQSTSEWSQIRINTGNVISHRWYSKGLANANMERIVTGSDAFTFIRNLVPVSNLILTANTTVRHQIEIIPANDIEPVAVHPYFYLIKVNTNDTSIEWTDNYNIKAINVPTNVDVSALHNLVNDGTFINPGTIVTVAPNTYKIECDVDGTMLAAGATYRVLALWATNDGTPGSNVVWYSFISNILTVNPCLQIDFNTVPDIEGSLSDFDEVYTNNYIIASPMIRILSRLLFDNTNYDASRSVPFATALSTINIKVFSIEGDLTHYYNNITLSKDAFGNWVDAQGASVVESPLEIDYIFRLRYESNIPNLFTINNVTNATLPPQTNNDWQGRLIYVQYTLIANQSSFVDEIRYTQLVQVRMFSTDMSFAIETLAGAPVVALCDSTGDFVICVTKPAGTDDLFVSLLDKPSYSISNISEHESFVPPTYTQLTNPSVVTQDSNFNNDIACSQLTTDLLSVGLAYKFCAVRKAASIAACGSQSNQQVGEVSNSYITNVGEDTGLIILAYQGYDIQLDGTEGQLVNNVAEDCFGLDWNGNFVQTVDANPDGSLTPTPDPPFAVLTDCFVWGPGYLAVDKTLATPDFATVYVQGGSALSRSWFKIFCPGHRISCGRSIVADLNEVFTDTAASPDQSFHVEAEVFALDITQLGMVTINYNNPDANFYMFSVHYNNAMVASSPGFITGSGTMNFNHNGSADYFVVIVTMFAIEFPDPLPTQEWSYYVSCPGDEADPQIPCYNIYEYELPSGIVDTQTFTQCTLLPVIQDCPDTEVSCDDLWNNSNCKLDRNYFQPICANPNVNECLHERYAKIVLDINVADLPIWGFAPVGVACSDECRIELPELIGGDYGTWAGQVNLIHAPNVIAFYNGNVITLLINSDAYCNACNYALCGREWYAFNRYGGCAEFIDNEITIYNPSVCCPGEDACCCPCLNRDMCKDIEDIVSALNYIRLNEDYYPASNDPVVVLAELFALGNLPNEPSHYLNVCYDIQFVTLVPIPEEIDGKGVVLIPKNECNYAFIGASYYNTLLERNCSAYCVNDVIGIPIIDLSQYPTFDYPCVATCAAGWHYERCSSLPEFDAATCDDDEPCPEGYDAMGTDCTQNDLIVLQFQFPDKFNDWLNSSPTHGWQENDAQVNWLIKIEVVDDCCEIVDIPFSQFATRYWVGYEGSNKTYYQQIEVDPQQIPNNCFGFKITLNDPDPCKVTEVFLEPYKKVGCERTVLLQGIFNGGFGCAKEVYEEPDQTYQTYFDYQNEYRIPGEFAYESFEITKEKASNNTVIRTVTTDLYRLRTPLVPPYVAFIIRNILAAPVIRINGEDFEYTGSTGKNNELGNMWLIDADFKKILCDKSNIKCV